MGGFLLLELAASGWKIFCIYFPVLRNFSRLKIETAQVFLATLDTSTAQETPRFSGLVWQNRQSLNRFYAGPTFLLSSLIHGNTVLSLTRKALWIHSHSAGRQTPTPQ
jgi:hypothetical protein